MHTINVNVVRGLPMKIFNTKIYHMKVSWHKNFQIYGTCNKAYYSLRGLNKINMQYSCSTNDNTIMHVHCTNEVSARKNYRMIILRLLYCCTTL